jgi:TPR repeat protein
MGHAKDLKKARARLRQAAKRHPVLSQEEYGAALALGEGVEQGVAEGLKWLIIAAQNGHEGATQFARIFSKSFPLRANWWQKRAGRPTGGTERTKRKSRPGNADCFMCI